MRKITAFVSLPNNEESLDVYRNAIRPIEGGNFKVVSFKDRPASPEGFEVAIRRLLSQCNLVIGIISGKIENVMYEHGNAIAYGKPVLPVSSSLKGIPAMLQDRHAIEFDAQHPEWDLVKLKVTQSCNDLLCAGIAEDRLKAHALNLIWHSKEIEATEPADLQGCSSDFERGHRAYLAKDYETAIGFLERCIEAGEAGEAGEEAYYYLSDSHFLLAEAISNIDLKRSHYRQQLRVAKEGHDRFPDHPDLQKNVGLGHLKLHHLPQAAKIFRHMIKSNPTYHKASYNLACVHSQQEDLLSCVGVLLDLFKGSGRGRQWRALARLDPDFDPVWNEELFQRVLFPSIPQD